MAIIKNITTSTQKPFVLKKIPLKEKWNDYKKRIAKKLHSRTKYWQSRHKKLFLIVFCSGFTGLLLLSLLEAPKIPSLGSVITVPTLSPHILKTKHQMPQRFLQSNTPHCYPSK